jgi:hypothetical protein
LDGKPCAAVGQSGLMALYDSLFSQVFIFCYVNLTTSLVIALDRSSLCECSLWNLFKGKQQFQRCQNNLPWFLSQSLRISLLSFSPSLSISMFSFMGARAKSSYYAEELSSSQPPSSAASLYWPFLYLSKLFATCCASLLL